jgi:transcriptional regulator with XRE-family HTH domain
MEELMKIDPEQVRKLREVRAWSQEHLAAVAGVSARTIQRVESEGAASAETRLAIAAAFGVAPAALLPAVSLQGAPTEPAAASAAAPSAIDATNHGRGARRGRELGNAVIWAAAIIAAAAMGGSTWLCIGLLPAMAFMSLLMARHPRPARCGATRPQA